MATRGSPDCTAAALATVSPPVAIARHCTLVIWQYELSAFSRAERSLGYWVS